MTRRMVWGELNRLDTAVYAAIARTPTPGLDQALGRLSRAADFSKLSRVRRSRREPQSDEALAALDRVILAMTVERGSAVTPMWVIRCPRYEGLK